MTTTTEIVTVPAERHQIARVLEFSETTAWHIDWNSVAKTARELGAHFEARWTDRGACTVTMFWSYADGEKE
jgi:hypothetical protein